MKFLYGEKKYEMDCLGIEFFQEYTIGRDSEYVTIGLYVSTPTDKIPFKLLRICSLDEDGNDCDHFGSWVVDCDNLEFCYSLDDVIKLIIEYGEVVDLNRLSDMIHDRAKSHGIDRMRLDVIGDGFIEHLAGSVVS